jgi:hypothetical protein
MSKTWLLGAAVLLLMIVDWFAFHDFFEPHTFRDYLTLFASGLVFLQFGMELVKGFNARTLR